MSAVPENQLIRVNETDFLMKRGKRKILIQGAPDQCIAEMAKKKLQCNRQLQNGSFKEGGFHWKIQKQKSSFKNNAYFVIYKLTPQAVNPGQKTPSVNQIRQDRLNNINIKDDFLKKSAISPENRRIDNPKSFTHIATFANQHYESFAGKNPNTLQHLFQAAKQAFSVESTSDRETFFQTRNIFQDKSSESKRLASLINKVQDTVKLLWEMSTSSGMGSTIKNSIRWAAFGLAGVAGTMAFDALANGISIEPVIEYSIGMAGGTGLYLLDGLRRSLLWLKMTALRSSGLALPTSDKINSTTRFALDKNQRLHLTGLTSEKSSPELQRENKEIVKTYYQHCLMQHGPKLVQQAESECQLSFQSDFDQCRSLTPNHITRMNAKLYAPTPQTLSELATRLHAVAKRGKKEQSLSDFFAEEQQRMQRQITTQWKKRDADQWIAFDEPSPPCLYGHECSQLLALLQKEHPREKLTTKHLVNWHKTLFQNDRKPLSSTQVSTLYSLLSTDLPTALTGKMDMSPLPGNCTQSSKQPWIAQRELRQAEQSLRNASDMNTYRKLLSSTVAKQPLITQASNGTWNIDKLIPAPNDSKGNSRWYQVTSLVDNGSGAIHYTLEPYPEENGLPATLLFPHATSAAHQMNSIDSICNDILAGKSPLDAHKEDWYALQFTKERTTTAWSACLEKAKAERNQEKKKIWLKKSLKALHDRERKMNLDKAWDELCKTALAPSQRWSAEKTKKLESFYSLFPHKQIKRMLKEVKKNPLGADLKKEVKAFEKDFNLWKTTNTTSGIRSSLQKQSVLFDEQDYLDALNGLSHLDYEADLAFVRNELEQQLAQKKPFKLSKKSINRLNTTRKERKKILQLQMNQNNLDKTINQLWNYADKIQELSQYKKHQSLAFTGDQLGGALSQEKLVHHLADCDRIPLARKHCQLSAFDAPAIDSKECIAWQEYMERYHTLLQSNCNRFDVNIHIQEEDLIFPSKQSYLECSVKERAIQPNKGVAHHSYYVCKKGKEQLLSQKEMRNLAETKKVNVKIVQKLAQSLVSTTNSKTVQKSFHYAKQLWSFLPSPSAFFKKIESTLPPHVSHVIAEKYYELLDKLLPRQLQEMGKKLVKILDNPDRKKAEEECAKYIMKSFKKFHRNILSKLPLKEMQALARVWCPKRMEAAGETDVFGMVRIGVQGTSSRSFH